MFNFNENQPFLNYDFINLENLNFKSNKFHF